MSDDKVIPFRANGSVPVPSPIAIRITELVSRKSLEPFALDGDRNGSPPTELSLDDITNLAFEVDAIMQLPAILNALEMLKKKVGFEAGQRQEAQRRQRDAELAAGRLVLDGYPKESMAGLWKAANEGETELIKLIKAMEDYIDYLHASEKAYVLPVFLKMEPTPEIYPKECMAKGHALRGRIADLVPAWLAEKITAPAPGALSQTGAGET